MRCHPIHDCKHQKSLKPNACCCFWLSSRRHRVAIPDFRKDGFPKSTLQKPMTTASMPEFSCLALGPEWSGRTKKRDSTIQWRFSPPVGLAPLIQVCVENVMRDQKRVPISRMPASSLPGRKELSWLPRPRYIYHPKPPIAHLIWSHLHLSSRPRPDIQKRQLSCLMRDVEKGDQKPYHQRPIFRSVLSASRNISKISLLSSHGRCCDVPARKYRYRKCVIQKGTRCDCMFSPVIDQHLRHHRIRSAVP
ncbi:hypothetical protein M011DRAFT_80442 [Sporormia fimetaria CBS 119925]|uniref:Uncharacterized protein n=1 Tax=Sporormia fimetaria CBS 119925 TaxID=1340428 RepID=A0A6A6V963_9PLEO|nr:hypothetical protein M011DRAFT_80442 [Sporormia fimetaria CBS 119925]